MSHGDRGARGACRGHPRALRPRCARARAARVRGRARARPRARARVCCVRRLLCPRRPPARGLPTSRGRGRPARAPPRAASQLIVGPLSRAHHRTANRTGRAARVRQARRARAPLAARQHQTEAALWAPPRLCPQPARARAGPRPVSAAAAPAQAGRPPRSRPGARAAAASTQAARAPALTNRLNCQSLPPLAPAGALCARAPGAAPCFALSCPSSPGRAC